MGREINMTIVRPKFYDVPNPSMVSEKYGMQYIIFDSLPEAEDFVKRNSRRTEPFTLVINYRDWKTSVFENSWIHDLRKKIS